MQAFFTASLGRKFNVPERSFGGLDATSTAKLIAATADLALILDRDGIIEDISISSSHNFPDMLEGWIGQPWVDTVSIESRPKVEEMLEASLANNTSGYRQINHPIPGSFDLPIKYMLHRLEGEERMIALGHDQSAVAQLQQRLVETQQSVEREYSRLRLAETRYRLLFQIVREPVLIIDGTSYKIREANPAALDTFNDAEKKIIGRSFVGRFDSQSKAAVEGLLDEVRSEGKSAEINAIVESNGEKVRIYASSFRQGGQFYILARLEPTAGDHGLSESNSSLSVLIDKMPDAFAVTDADQRIISANSAFLDLVQMPDVSRVKGQPIHRWLGRTEIDFRLMMNALKEQDVVSRFATAVRGEYGVSEELETSIVAVDTNGGPCYGYSLRRVPQRNLGEVVGGKTGLQHSVEQLSQLVGRVPLKDIVRETTDMIERMCIEAALELTEDNRASAADVLGLSRQSLYVKLRRFGLQGSENGDKK